MQPAYYQAAKLVQEKGLGTLVHRGICHAIAAAHRVVFPQTKIIMVMRRTTWITRGPACGRTFEGTRLRP